MISDNFSQHFEVTPAECGVEAIQIMQEHPRNHFDAILIDVDLPIMDGFELFKNMQTLIKGSSLSAFISAHPKDHRSHTGPVVRSSRLLSKQLERMSRTEGMPQDKRSPLIKPRGKPAPLIYALVQRTDESTEAKLKMHSFKKVYSLVDDLQISEILADLTARDESLQKHGL